MFSTESGLSVFKSVQPLCPACPPGLRPLVLRSVLVRRTTSSCIFSLEGGVLLLLEFLSGVSYFARRFLRSSIIALRLLTSTFSLLMLRLRLHIVSCCESMVFCIDPSFSFMLFSTSAISVTVSFTDTKVRKKSEINKQKQNYFHTYFAD